METRQTIRRHYKKMRDDMPSALAARLSLELSGHILEWERYRQAETVFFYYPLGNEVSLLPVMKDALFQKKRVAFPKTDGERMDFYVVTDLKQLKEGSFHVMEPAGIGKLPVNQEPDLCFVPGIVFDRAGRRFGYGRGYYDRYFADRKVGIMAGCAYECQIADRLPVHAWDVPMDYVVSECGIGKSHKAVR